MNTSNKIIEYENVKTELRNICFCAAFEKYSNALPSFIHERIEKELIKIENYHLEADWLLAIKIIKKCKELNLQTFTSGCTAASFLLYLGGVTNTNPLPPHYYCPQCKTVELVDSRKYRSGLDLINSNYGGKATCSKCGSDLSGDGNNIPYESLFGYDEIMLPNIILHIEAKHFKEIISHAKDLLGNNAITAHEPSKNKPLLELNKIKIWSSDMLKLLKCLEEYTSIKFENIKFEEIDIFDFFLEKSCADIPSINENFIRIVSSQYFPVVFSDVVKILGLGSGAGTWYDNAQYLAGNVCWPQKVIAFPEDIMFDLTDYGIEWYVAYKIAQCVQKGKWYVLSEKHTDMLKEHAVPNWYIESMQKIHYLVPKSHATEYAFVLLKLIWYKIHYPVEFNKAVLSQNEMCS